MSFALVFTVISLALLVALIIYVKVTEARAIKRMDEEVRKCREEASMKEWQERMLKINTLSYYLTIYTVDGGEYEFYLDYETFEDFKEDFKYYPTVTLEDSDGRIFNFQIINICGYDFKEIKKDCND